MDIYLDSLDRYLDRRTQTVWLGPVPAEAVAVEGGGARHRVAAVAAEPGDTEIFVDICRYVDICGYVDICRLVNISSGQETGVTCTRPLGVGT